MKAALTLLLVSLLLAGCNDATRAPISYDVRTVNHIGVELEEVQARLGEFRCRSGFLGAGASATYVDFSYPLATDADVYWKRTGDDTYWSAHLAALSWPDKPNKDLERSQLEIEITEQRVTLRLHIKCGATVLLGEAEPLQISKDEAPQYWK